MNHLLRGAAALALAALVLPAFADDPKGDSPKPNPAEKKDARDDKTAGPAPAKEATPADPSGKDAKKDAAKKDEPKKDAPKKDEPKKDPAKKPAKKDEHLNTEKTVKSGQVTGRIVAVAGSGKSFRLSVGISIPKPDLNTVNAVATYRASAQQAAIQAQQVLGQAQQAIVQAQQAAAKKDSNGLSQNMNQAAQYQAQAAGYQLQAAQYNALASRLQGNLYTYETRYQEVEITTTEGVVVRTAIPPEVYDSRGKLRRPTAKELKEAKGDDPKLPGYQADFSSLREKQVVAVTLVKKKDVPKVDKKDAGLFGDHKSQASLIVIIAEPAESR